MKTLVRAIRALFGLFVDDGSLALAILGVLATLILLKHGGLIESPFAMAILVAGTIAALLENVVRTARRRKRQA